MNALAPDPYSTAVEGEDAAWEDAERLNPLPPLTVDRDGTVTSRDHGRHTWPSLQEALAATRADRLRGADRDDD
jgi:hypothetical protein